MFWLFAGFVGSVVVGLDFGNGYIKAGVIPLGKSVYVALNEDGKRLSPAYFAWWNSSMVNQTVREKHWSLAEIRACSWSYFDAAYEHFLRHGQNVFHGLSPINGEYNGLMKREYVAIVIRHLLSTIDNSAYDPASCQVVMAVNPSVSAQDRYLLHEVTKLAGATLLKIVEAPVAAANLYALEKTGMYSDGAKLVMFVDVGAASSWMSLFRIAPVKGSDPLVEQLSLVPNIHISGDEMDERIAKFLEEKFQNSNGTVTSRLHLQFLNEARIAKERISLHNEVEIEVDDAFGSESFTSKLTRNEFEMLVEDMSEILRESYLVALREANVSALDVDYVELVGGGTRVPFVQTVLSSVSGLEKLNRTMNADEAVALGAAYIGASDSAELVSIRKAKIVPIAHTNASLLHKGQLIKLFDVTDKLDATASYEFKSSDNEFISMLVGTPPVEIFQFRVDLPKTASGNVTIHVDFGFDEFTLPGIYNVNLNKLSSENVTFKNPVWALTKATYNRSAAFINRMDIVTKERAETQRVYNDFESYLYEAQERLATDNSVMEVTTEEERANLIKLTSDHMFWLVNKTHKMPLTSRIINDKWRQFNSTILDVYFKAKEYPKREPAFKALWDKIEYCKHVLDVVWPSERPWMKEKTRNKMRSSIDHAIKYYWIYKEQQGNRTKFEVPGVRARDIKRQTYYLEMVFNHTLRKTAHAPTPKPEKTPFPFVKVFNSPEEFEKTMEENERREMFGTL